MNVRKLSWMNRAQLVVFTLSLGFKYTGKTGPRFNRLMKIITKIIMKHKFEKETCPNFFS